MLGSSFPISPEKAWKFYYPLTVKLVQAMI
jgi:hypothetical protein